MFSKLSHIICLIVMVCLFSISSCRKTDVVQPEAKKVFISNLIQLYAGINDPLNEGSTLVLAPGTYRLNPDFPNGGRIELKHNMSLIGQEGNASAVIIDVSGLPAASYVAPPTASYPLELRTAPIRIGNGKNAIEWMTFTNDPSNILRAMIMTDIVAKQIASDPAPLAQVRIAHTIIKNSSIGLNILNRDPVSDGRVLEAEVENNEILDNTQPQFGSGVQIQHSQGVTAGLIRVNFKGNYIHGNMQGVNMFNASSGGNNRIIARSISDRLEGNALGLLLTSGLNVAGGAERVTGNSINFEAEGTSIRNNGNLPAPLTNSFLLNNYIAGGVMINGGAVGKIGNSRGAPGTVGSNTVEAVFKDSRIEDNLGTSQINIFGAYSNLFPLPAGSYNNAVLTLIGISKKATVNAVTSFPFEPAVTNTITVK